MLEQDGVYFSFAPSRAFVHVNHVNELALSPDELAQFYPGMKPGAPGLPMVADDIDGAFADEMENPPQGREGRNPDGSVRSMDGAFQPPVAEAEYLSGKLFVEWGEPPPAQANVVQKALLGTVTFGGGAAASAIGAAVEAASSTEAFQKAGQEVANRSVGPVSSALASGREKPVVLRVRGSKPRGAGLNIRRFDHRMDSDGGRFTLRLLAQKMNNCAGDDKASQLAVDYARNPEDDVAAQRLIDHEMNKMMRRQVARGPAGGRLGAARRQRENRPLARLKRFLDSKRIG